MLTIIMILFELLSIICAAYLSLFADINKLTNKRFDQPEMTVWAIALLSGWCTFPVIALLVWKNAKEKYGKF